MCIYLRGAFPDILQFLTAANHCKLSMWTETNRTGLSRRHPQTQSHYHQTHHTMCLHLQSPLNTWITVKNTFKSHPVIVFPRKWQRCLVCPLASRRTCSRRFCQRPQGLSSKISLSSSLSSSFPPDPDMFSGTDIVILPLRAALTAPLRPTEHAGPPEACCSVVAANVFHWRISLVTISSYSSVVKRIEILQHATRFAESVFKAR